jgi:hypothetical protein
VSDLGGIAACSSGERGLVQRLASLSVELEHMEGRLSRSIDGVTTGELLSTYTAVAKTYNRLLQTLGLRRRPRDVTPDLRQYLAEQSPAPPISGTPDPELK